MAVYSWEDGIVNSSEGGPVALVTEPCQTTRRTLYVDENHPNASDTNAGTERNMPFATLGGTNGLGDTNGAYFSAAAGEIIWIAPLQTESVTITIAKIGVSIIGGGQGTSRPILAPKSANAKIFNITADAVEIDNIAFVELADGAPAEMVTVDGDFCHLRRLTFSLASYTDAIIVGAGDSATFCLVRDCEFVNVSAGVKTGTTYKPTHGISLAHATQCVGFEARGNTFDGGIDTFRLGGINCTVGLTGVTIWQNTLTNGASFIFSSTSFRGILSDNALAPSCRITIAAHNYEYPSGLVDQAVDGGHDFLAGPNVILTTLPIWVDTANGNDSNAGTNRKKPLATILQAITNFTGAGGGVIIVERNSSETFVYASEAARVVSKNDFKLFGLGTTSDRPILRHLATGNPSPTPTDGPVLKLTGTNSGIYGFQFPASTVEPDTYLVWLAAAGGTLEGCAFTQGALDYSPVGTSAKGFTVINNTATVAAAGPNCWLETITHVDSICLIENNSVDGADDSYLTGGILATDGAGSFATCITNTLLGGATINAASASSNVAVYGTITESSLGVEWT